MIAMEYVEEIQPELDEGFGCIILDLGCYFPYVQQNELIFYFTIGMDRPTDFKLNHRYPNRGYMTISKKIGRKVSKLGYPYFCKLGKQEMFFTIHVGFGNNEICLLFPLEVTLTKESPVCGLNFYYNFDESTFSFCTNGKNNNLGWSGTKWTNDFNCEPKGENVIILDSPELVNDNTLLFSNVLMPIPQKIEDLMI